MTTLTMCDLPLAFTTSEIRVQWSSNAWMLGHAHRLRREVFCDEQGVFDCHDLDAIDTGASPHQTLVALTCLGGMADEVVGTVRIHEAEPGLWWGSRLAVAASHRRHGQLGSSLIRLAVSSAHARGCTVFLAHVQAQNRRLFERLHWQPLRDLVLHSRPHTLMQADLAHYPPCFDPYSGYVLARGGKP